MQAAIVPVDKMNRLVQVIRESPIPRIYTDKMLECLEGLKVSEVTETPPPPSSDEAAP